MEIEANKLLINEQIDYDDCSEFLELASNEDVEEIIVDTNDIHPSIFQLLLIYSDDKKITINDEFNQRFFNNLSLTK
ncbi:MAG: hypothetical protein U9R39_10320 [Campylobacterota bacterium]|nr:hypothetical protein [Campylobacterota bacterium]